MEQILHGIARANQEEISTILDATLHRYEELYPDWEISTISIQRSEDRVAQLDKMITVLQSIKSASN